MYTGLTQNEAADMERKLISEWNTMFPSGYNLTSGGELHKKYPPEVCKRISNSKKGKPPSNKGISPSEEVREKMSVAAKNKPPVSDETRKKMSKARKGIPRSDEFKKRISEVQKKPVLQRSKGGEIINKYNSIQEAAAAVGVTSSSICGCLRGWQKTCGGCLWEYV